MLHVRRFWLVLALVAALALWAVAGVSADPTDPNDPFWPDEWGVALTRASDLWQYTTGNPGIVIAVVDTGYTHRP